MAEESSSSVKGESPGGRPMGAWGITLVTIYLVAVAVVVFHSLVVLWPPYSGSPDAGRQGQQQQAGKGTEPGGKSTASLPATDLTTNLTTDLSTTDLAAASLTTGMTSDLMGTEMTPGSGEKGPSKTKAEGGEDQCECENGQKPAKLFWLFCLCLSDEERLFLIVMFAGALGGLVHALRSFYWYAGARKLVLSWAGFYITLPVLGATMATIFYLVIRGGFFSPESSIRDTSTFGFAALAALIGMFTEQAADKLKQIAATIFTPAPKGPDHAGPELKVSGISPPDGSLAGKEPVTITGKGFVQGATVTFGGQSATDVKVAADGNSLTAVTPAASVPGAVDVEVTNPDKKKSVLPGGFTYK